MMSPTRLPQNAVAVVARRASPAQQDHKRLLAQVRQAAGAGDPGGLEAALAELEQSSEAYAKQHLNDPAPSVPAKRDLAEAARQALHECLKGFDGTDPQQHANLERCVEVALKMGADPARPTSGLLPVQLAASAGASRRIFELLAEFRGDLHAIGDRKNRWPAAALVPDQSTLQNLVSVGFDPFRPIGIAGQPSHGNTVEILAAKGMRQHLNWLVEVDPRVANYMRVATADSLVPPCLPSAPAQPGQQPLPASPGSGGTAGRDAKPSQPGPAAA